MSDAIRILTLRELGLGAIFFAAFVAVLFVASLVVPGRIEEGVVLEGGGRERYRLNGLALFVLTAAGAGGLLAFRPGVLAEVHAHFWGLLVAANVFGFVVPAILAVRGRARVPGHRPRAPGVLGALADYFYGVELNPKLLGLDIKMFSYRPSLLGLGVLNASFAAEQIRVHGGISPRMAMYQIFYLVYLTNYFQFEYGMLHTWDIIAERFGWMLVWGDYVLVPFFYSIPGWYLVDATDPLSPAQIAGLAALYTIGIVLFRGSNEQKHRFKTHPEALIWGKPPEALGGRLLVSGFWGIGRKLNYTGELCMYYAWTLTTGLTSVVPYLLPIWLTLFFPHRAWRDEQRCLAKYGELWRAYEKRARFRMIPFIF
jgi:delta14-sterol reductase